MKKHCKISKKIVMHVPFIIGKYILSTGVHESQTSEPQDAVDLFISESDAWGSVSFFYNWYARYLELIKRYALIDGIDQRLLP
jgi:hypothetical protein